MAEISKITVGGTTYNIKDSKVTSADNHYTPTANANSVLSSQYKIITAIQRDAKGHVTGIQTNNNITKISYLNGSGKYDSVYDLLQATTSSMETLVQQGGCTHLELIYNKGSQDTFPYLTLASTDDFTECVETWLTTILQGTLYGTAEYKMHFSFLEPNKDDVKTTLFSKITSFTSNGILTNGHFELSPYILAGLSNMGFSVEIVANKIGSSVYVHHNITPFIND